MFIAVLLIFCLSTLTVDYIDQGRCVCVCVCVCVCGRWSWGLNLVYLMLLIKLNKNTINDALIPNYRFITCALLMQMSGWSWSLTCCSTPLESWARSPGLGSSCLPTPCLFPTIPCCSGGLFTTASHSLSWACLSAQACFCLQCRSVSWEGSLCTWLYTTSCHQPQDSLSY